MTSEAGGILIGDALVTAVAIYLALGLLFAAAFVTRWVDRLDANAAAGSRGFRAVIVPGVIALWPLLLVRVMRGPRSDVETAHDRAASAEVRR